MERRNQNQFYVYILECADGSYYTGSTSDIDRRLWEHEAGVDIKAYTYSRRPIKLVWCDIFPTKEEALAFEYQIKGWSRKKKQALIQNDWDTIHQIVKEERKRREGKKKSNNRVTKKLALRLPLRVRSGLF